MKNSATQISEGLRKVRRAWTLLLTGTPLQNNLTELYVRSNDVELCPAAVQRGVFE